MTEQLLISKVLSRRLVFYRRKLGLQNCVSQEFLSASWSTENCRLQVCNLAFTMQCTLLPSLEKSTEHIFNIPLSFGESTCLASVFSFPCFHLFISKVSWGQCVNMLMILSVAFLQIFVNMNLLCSNEVSLFYLWIKNWYFSYKMPDSFSWSLPKGNESI